MLIFPGSKINLGLRILGKRPDGFHKLHSTFYPLSLTDILEIIPSDRFEFIESGNSIPGKSESNIVIKAHQLLKAEHGIGFVRIHLHKIVPTGAGLGGGSANGAAALKIMNKVFTIGLSADQLREYALELGSDCPFFIENVPADVSGRGENLEPSSIDLSNCYIKVVYPNLHISTADAFSRINLSNSKKQQEAINFTNRGSWKEILENDFESGVFDLYPEIKNIKAGLYKDGAFFASMTGSGSSIYGFFKDEPSKDSSGYFQWISRL
ncbi:4-(cytidine 5'-diphospho)-2-C-methyl-D-erythritol kinase [Crocinitomix catalasitica]|nr:4-(cytidine 5'-diphospho)-2-C-methyl-D-erythritol kinase [Crocinitomix catalasitica]